MANVLFKRGLQKDVPLSTAQDGVFYLTQDTNRLYVGQGTKAILLNQTVNIIPTINDLKGLTTQWGANANQHINDFYYISESNILAVYTGSGEDNGWVQINPDTNTKNKSASVAASSNTATNTANVDISVTDTDDISVTASMAVKGLNGISVDANNGVLEISGDPYALSGDIANGQLNLVLNNGSTTHTVVVKAKGAASLVKDNGELFISSENTVNESASLSVGDGGVLNVSITDSDSQSVAATAAIGIKLSDNTFMPIVETDGLVAAASAIYSRADIDQMFRGLNGMTFKGSVSDVLPTSNVSVGDVYIVATNGAASAVHAGTIVGDLFIAKLASGATEDANGYIPANKLEWTYVPSGNEDLADVTYTPIITTANHQLILQDGNDITKAGIVLNAGTNIALSSTESATGVLATTINHASISTTTTAAAALSNGAASFTAIKGLTISNGHVTAIETDTFTPVTYDLSGATATVANNKATVGIGLVDSNNIAQTGANFSIESSSLTITATGTNGIVADMVWGTF